MDTGRTIVVKATCYDTPACTAAYFSGMKREECVAPMPGRPCFTGLYEIEYSPV